MTKTEKLHNSDEEWRSQIMIELERRSASPPPAPDGFRPCATAP